MKRALTTLILALGLSSAAAGQTVKPPDANSSVASSDASNDPCAQGHATVGTGNEIITPNTNKGNQTLSDHLAKSGGVICPPQAVDPSIRAPTPQGGAMPVIPPPGTPGGDQSVQPK